MNNPYRSCKLRRVRSCCSLTLEEKATQLIGGIGGGVTRATHPSDPLRALRRSAALPVCFPTHRRSRVLFGAAAIRDLVPPYQYHSEGLHGLRSTCGGLRAATGPGKAAIQAAERQWKGSDVSPRKGSDKGSRTPVEGGGTR